MKNTHVNVKYTMENLPLADRLRNIFSIIRAMNIGQKSNDLIDRVIGFDGAIDNLDQYPDYSIDLIRDAMYCFRPLMELYAEESTASGACQNTTREDVMNFLLDELGNKMIDPKFKPDTDAVEQEVQRYMLKNFNKTKAFKANVLVPGC